MFLCLLESSFLDELGEVERGPCEGMNTKWTLPAVLVNVGKLNFGEDFLANSIFMREIYGFCTLS